MGKVRPARPSSVANGTCLTIPSDKRLPVGFPTSTIRPRSWCARRWGCITLSVVVYWYEIDMEIPANTSPAVATRVECPLCHTPCRRLWNRAKTDFLYEFRCPPSCPRKQDEKGRISFKGLPKAPSRRLDRNPFALPFLWTWTRDIPSKVPQRLVDALDYHALGGRFQSMVREIRARWPKSIRPGWLQQELQKHLAQFEMPCLQAERRLSDDKRAWSLDYTRRHRKEPTPVEIIQVVPDPQSLIALYRRRAENLAALQRQKDVLVSDAQIARLMEACSIPEDEMSRYAVEWLIFGGSLDRQLEGTDNGYDSTSVKFYVVPRGDGYRNRLCLKLAPWAGVRDAYQVLEGLVATEWRRHLSEDARRRQAGREPFYDLPQPKDHRVWNQGREVYVWLLTSSKIEINRLWAKVTALRKAAGITAPQPRKRPHLDLHKLRAEVEDTIPSKVYMVNNGSENERQPSRDERIDGKLIKRQISKLPRRPGETDEQYGDRCERALDRASNPKKLERRLTTIRVARHRRHRA